MSQPRFDIPDVPPRWRLALWIAPPVLLLGLLALLVTAQARHLAQRSLELAFGAGPHRYGSLSFGLGGELRLHDLELHPAGSGEAERWQAVRLRIDAGGWHGFLRNLLHRQRLADETRHLVLQFDGFSAPAGRDPGLGDLGPFAVAASPFEAEGCLGRRQWTANDLRSMELPDVPGQLRLELRVIGNTLTRRFGYAVPGVSSVELRQQWRLPKPLNALLVDQYPRLLLEETWQVEDQGFVSARNRYCARREHSDAGAVAEHHVQVVERILRSLGLRLDAASRDRYQQFAREGGRLALRLDHHEGFDERVAASARGEAASLLAADAAIAGDGDFVATGWSALEPRPFAAWWAGKPGLDALRQEQLGLDAAAADIPMPTLRRAAVALDLASLGETDPESLRASLLRTDDPAAAASTVASAPATAVVPATPPDATRGTDEPALTTDHDGAAAVAPTAPAVTAAAPATAAAGATEAGAGTPRIERLTSGAPTPVRADVLGWDDLPRYIGRRVRIETEAGGARIVDIVAASPEELLVRARLGGGNAEFRVRREGFKQARLVR